MGFEDRDYAREPHSSGWAAFFAGLSATWILVGLTVITFVLQKGIENAGGRGFVLDQLALSATGLSSARIWQPLTYQFLHANLGHLFWNMFVLVIFLWILQGVTSRNRLIGQYLVTGLAGAAFHLLLFHVASASGHGVPDIPVVGASGAVTGILVLATLRAPKMPILLFFVLPCPLWVLSVVYLAGDVLGLVGGGTNGIAYSVHVGGALGGALLHYRPWERWRGRRPARTHSPGRFRDPAYPPPPLLGHPEEPRSDSDEARVDALLDRINAEGIDALSEEERQFLKRISRRYRNR